MNVSVCLFVCPLACLDNHSAELYQFSVYIRYVDCGRGPVLLWRRCDLRVAICYVLPVLWMMLCFHIIGPMARHVYLSPNNMSIGSAVLHGSCNHVANTQTESITLYVNTCV